MDTDGDGLGDNIDTDDDNDGFLDIFDKYPRYAGIPTDDSESGTDGDSEGQAGQSPSDSDSLTVGASDLLTLLLISSIASVTIVLLAQKIWTGKSEEKVDEVTDGKDSEDIEEVEV